MASKPIGIKDEKSYAELERVEIKHIVPLELLPIIEAEVKKHLKPAYPDKSTSFVKINTTYLDSNDMEFFRYHSYGMTDRVKVRMRMYGADGKMDKSDVFLEIKEKNDNEVKKYRVQLDSKNIQNVKSGVHLEFNKELEELNSPLYSHTDLKRYCEKYNKIATKYEITPVLTNQYIRKAYGEDSLRITMDTNLSFKANRTIALSQAYKIKKSSKWDVVKSYGKKYDPKKDFILEIKTNKGLMPLWLQNLLNDNDIEETKFSKYVYCCYNLLREIVGE